MSTNIKVDRVCEHCGKLFTARTTKTRFCSHTCNQRAYKLQLKKDNIELSNLESSQAILSHETNEPQTTVNQQKETINIKELSIILGVSERTLFRLLKTNGFPKIKLGRKLMFNKQAVMNFITIKYG